MKIYLYLRLHIKINKPKVSHYNTVYFMRYAHPSLWDMHTQVYEMFIYKHTETMEYVKK